MKNYEKGKNYRGRESRVEIYKMLEFLGVKIDEQANQDAFAKEARISSDDSKVLVYVVPTNEELMIAKETKRIIEK